MVQCENCSNEHEGTFGSGRFCSLKCSRAFSTKAKRKEINEKVSSTLRDKGRNSVFHENAVCVFCRSSFSRWCNYKPRFCSRACSIRSLLSQEHVREACSRSAIKRCSTLEERVRLREIGRKGGFGSKGYTAKGTFFQSKLEKRCFEFLENNEVVFEAHKHIPFSAKISDIYIPHLDLWVELDGINREEKKKWLGKDYEYWQEKLQLYSHLNLHLKIFTCFEDFEKEFRSVA